MRIMTDFEKEKPDFCMGVKLRSHMYIMRLRAHLHYNY